MKMSEKLAIHKQILKGWKSLPRKVKKVYKITIASMIFVGALIYSNVSSTPQSELQSRVSLPPAETSNSMDKQGDTGELDYALRAGLKQTEEELQRTSIDNNQTYLPNNDNLELTINDHIDFENPTKPEPKPESEVIEKPEEAMSNVEFSNGRGRNDRSQVGNVDREAFEAKVNTRLSILQALQQAAIKVDQGGELAVRNYPVDLSVDGNASIGVNGSSAPVANQIISTIQPNTLTAGDVVIVQLDNYLNSDDNGKYVRLTMLSPLEGPIIMGEYTRQGGYLNVTTSTISFNGVTKPFKGILVTTDGKMQSGITTDTDYHTAYRWGALVLSGALTGIGELYLNSADRVIKENGDIYETSSRDGTDILVGIGKGIGDRTATIAEKEFDTPPTVIADPKEQAIWGVMLVQDTVLEGFPLIDRNSLY
jgi:hypothetical protein